MDPKSDGTRALKLDLKLFKNIIRVRSTGLI